MTPKEWIAAATRCDVWDVIVLGAGPAGAVAARQLALHNRRVLLVEKSRLPRFKVCGGCLGGAALAVLKSIGLTDLPTKCGGVRLRTMQLASGGSTVNVAIGARVAISRQTFDEALVREAVQAGAMVCDETIGTLLKSPERPERFVKLQRRGRDVVIRAKVVLIATGLSSSASNDLTHFWSKSRIGIGVLLKRPHSYPNLGLLQMAVSSSGYVGLAPVNDDQLHIAAAVDARALAIAHSPGSLLGDILQEAGLPSPDGLESANWRGTPMLTQQTRPLGGHRFLRIGDAAGYAEPFTGEGIGWAMHSAVLTGSLLEEGIDRWDAGLVRRWERLYQEALLHRHRRCHAIARLLRSKTIRRVAIWGLRRAPSLALPLVRQIDRPIAACNH